MPLYYSAFGPKALALAGEQADGVILFTGDRHIDTLEQRIAAVHAAAREAGRDPAKIDIWAVSFASIRETRAQAIDDLKAFRSEEHTSELQSLMRISYAVFCLKKQKEKDYE